MVTYNGKTSKPNSSSSRVKRSHRLLLTTKSQLQRHTRIEKSDDDVSMAVNHTTHSDKKKKQQSSTNASSNETVSNELSSSGKLRVQGKKQSNVKHQRRSTRTIEALQSATTSYTSSASNPERGSVVAEEEERPSMFGPYAEGSVANIVLSRLHHKSNCEDKGTTGTSRNSKQVLFSSTISGLQEERKDTAQTANSAASARAHSISDLTNNQMVSGNERITNDLQENRNGTVEGAREGYLEATEKSNGREKQEAGTVLQAEPIADLDTGHKTNERTWDEPVLPARSESTRVFLLRTEIQRQPRPSPPFATLVKVIEGPYIGMTGYLSPTGTYGYSIISNASGWFATINDNHVVDSTSHSTKPTHEEEGARGQEQQNPTSMEDSSNEEDPIQTFFLEHLRNFVHDDHIDSQKRQVEQLRSSVTRSNGRDHDNEELQQLREELLRLQEDKLEKLYATHPVVKVATSALGELASSPKKASKKRPCRTPRPSDDGK